MSNSGDYDNLDALLADLQNSVPGHQPQHQQQPHYATTQTVTSVQQQRQVPQPQHHQQQQQQHNYIESSSGYGSLRGKAPPPTQPIYQEHYSETRTSVSPSAGQPHHLGGYNGIGNSNSSSHYQNQGAIPRQQYNGTNVGGMGPTSASLHQQQLNTASNLSELDSLLQDLSSARYNGNGYDRKDTSGPSGFHSTPSSKYNTYNSYASVEERPTVDSLLNEMDNASLYAVPNGARTKSPTPGRHVTITVRETKTENLAGPEGPVRQMEEKVVKQKDSFTPNNAAHQAYASSATKELDDLMASLSDLKVNNGSNHYHQTITDYAKPNKGTSHLTQTITETTTSTLVEDNQPDQLDSMLGSLQANMNRQGVNTVQKGCCNACEKPIVGQVITALGKTWHPEHFTCNHCNQELGTRNFFERDGFPYCEPDYHNLFSPRCAYCNGAILDKCVTALDKTWHTEHFFCAQCGQQFGEDGFHERDGKPYCRNDYFEMFAPKCNGCNRAIMENYISALNSQWHPDCFVCRDCRQPFHGGSFFDHEGLPYCETHYHAKRGSLCAGCSKPITGRCITAMFKKFHPEHFVCAFCLKQLNKGTFKEQNDKPYCHTCFEKIFG
ncbi:leupaxin isoform X3 [Lucilia cuprina]|uniref:leupaxin isoform X3 n=1 Tax=Lucilia cuprina TaxID=7375 RepID=UPI001F06A263|nr:leupaxin isoform X3 [Lucilia cuprina]